MLSKELCDLLVHSAQVKHGARKMSKGLAVVLCDDQHENLELWYPRLRLEEAGYDAKLVGVKAKEKYTSKEGYWAFTDCVFSDIDPKEVQLCNFSYPRLGQSFDRPWWSSLP